MKASKEDCARAEEAFDDVVSRFVDDEHGQDDAVLLVKSFLLAARKRLPSEAAIAKDLERGKCRKAGSKPTYYGGDKDAD